MVDLVEAAVNTARPAEAQAHAAAARETGLGTLSPRLDFLTRAVSAMTAPDEEALRLFAEALAAPGLDRWPFDLARADLAYGERLRGAKAAAPARAHLTAAWERFDRLGARPWAERASTALRAAGARPARARPAAAAVLTPQQHQIATLAAEGLTNKQIGAQLFLSPRTVGAHLYQLFPKLGVTSRAALRDALTTPEEPPWGQSFD
jgi:DNA-binding CsgD family transcriptional regulator